MSAVTPALLAAALALAPQATVEEQFEEAARCRVHSEMLPAVLAENPNGRQLGEAVYAYWIRESNRLADELGLTQDERTWRYLVIEITADTDLLRACILGARDRPEE